MYLAVNLPALLVASARMLRVSTLSHGQLYFTFFLFPNPDYPKKLVA